MEKQATEERNFPLSSLSVISEQKLYLISANFHFRAEEQNLNNNATPQPIKSFKPVLLDLKLLGCWTKTLAEKHQVVLMPILKLRKTEFREIT